ncbi:hypothetical protein ACWKWP_09180 [Agromyces soli]
MELTREASTEQLYALRSERLNGLRAKAQALQDRLEMLRARVPDDLNAELTGVIRLTFDTGGILARVEIDDARRAHATARELVLAFEREFATSPVPKRFMRSPGWLDAVERADHRTEHATSDGRLVLVTCLGRPITLRVDEQALLFTSSAELADAIVGLARRAATVPAMTEAP